MNYNSLRLRLPIAVFGGLLPLLSVSADEPTVATPEQVFNERILPIFRSPNPSSCVQCHLASVDLKDYILPSSEKTFVSLRDQGLVDLNRPGESKILTLIRMGEKDADDASKLIHQKLRTAELQAFASWIEACCKNERLRSLPASTELAKPAEPNAVIRHARKSRVVDSFARNIWSQRMRCFPCHTPLEIDASNPKHRVAVKRQKEFEEQYSPEMLGRLRFFRESPEATLDYLLMQSKKATKDRLPIINVKDPSRSLLILKPTAKLPNRREDKTFEAPTYVEPISHMGGLKMHKDDQSYKAFLAWLTDYSNLTQGAYTSVADLPADNWLPTLKVLRLKDVPQTWTAGLVVQMFIYREGQADPIAFTQGLVTPRRMVNGPLFLLGATDGSKERFSELRPGTYVVKVFADHKGKIQRDAATMLKQEDYVGSMVVDAQWRDGFRFAETIDANELGELATALRQKKEGE